MSTRSTVARLTPAAIAKSLVVGRIAQPLSRIRMHSYRASPAEYNPLEVRTSDFYCADVRTACTKVVAESLLVRGSLATGEIEMMRHLALTTAAGALLTAAGAAKAEDLTLCWAAWDPANALVELSKDFEARVGQHDELRVRALAELRRPDAERAELAAASFAT